MKKVLCLAVAMFIGVLVIVMAFTTEARADDPTTTFNGTVDHDWNDPDNWSNGVPDSATVAIIDHSCEITAGGSYCVALDVQINSYAGLIIKGKGLTTDDISIGDAAIYMEDGYIYAERIETSSPSVTAQLLISGSAVIEVTYLTDLQIALAPDSSAVIQAEGS